MAEHAKRAERIAAVGERWSLRFADLAEVAVYCPECDEREFGDG